MSMFVVSAAMVNDGFNHVRDVLFRVMATE